MLFLQLPAWFGRCCRLKHRLSYRPPLAPDAPLPPEAPLVPGVTVRFTGILNDAGKLGVGDGVPLAIVVAPELIVTVPL